MAFAKTIKYELTVERTQVNLSGQRPVDFALRVNGQIPAPTLEFTEGDTAEITLTNHTHEEVSLHWHGLLVPVEMDGVPYLTTPPIYPGHSYTFRFPLRQSGTYWYHSHTMLQEQRGVYGAIVIHPQHETYRVDHDVVAVLSDWTDENPSSVLKHLKKDGDYYQYKKNTVRSIWGAADAGKFGPYLQAQWSRMGGMDLSDVGYDAFLINGKRQLQLVDGHPGETVRVRLINAAASSYFYINLGQQKMRVIAIDGQPVAPVDTQQLLLGMAQTADILFRIPEQRNYELRATAQDVSGQASAWIGMGDRESAPDLPKPDLYEMHHDHAAMGHDHGHEHHGHEMHHEMNDTAVPFVPQLNDSHLRAPAPTAFAQNLPRYEMRLELDGDMSRYTWFINGAVISEDKLIEITPGDVVRFELVNKTMMHHPMHLHGHFFRVLNSQGEFAPLRHTVDVGPYETRVIEFRANEPGQWMLHCHNLYHLKTGMAKVVSYKGYQPSADIRYWQQFDPHDMDHWYTYGSGQAFTNSGELYLRASQTRNQIDARIEARQDEDWTAQGEILGHRWMGKYWNLLGGATAYERETRAVMGAGVILPLLIDSAVYLDSKAKLRLDLSKRLQWTKLLYSDVTSQFRDSFEPEWSASLMLAPSWTWAWGAKLTNRSVGLGLTARF